MMRIFISLLLFLRLTSVLSWAAPFSIQIQHPLPTEAYINLAEVEVLAGTTVVSGTSCSLSGVYSTTLYLASLCCDGIKTNFCVSNQDVNAKLTVSVPSIFDTIKVYNRADGGMTRIVGADIKVFDSTGVLAWSGTFSSNLATYSFAVTWPTANPTSIAYRGLY